MMRKLLSLMMLMAVWLIAPTQSFAASTIYVKGNITASPDDGEGWSDYTNYDANKMTKISETLFYYHVDPNACFSKTGNNWFRFDIDGENTGAGTNNTNIAVQAEAYSTASNSENNFIYNASLGECNLILEQIDGNWNLFVQSGFATAELSSNSEVSFFYEAPATATYKVWAWNGTGFDQAKGLGTTNWNSRPTMTKVGYTAAGKVLYKYVFGGTAAPANFQVTKNGTTIFDGIAFVNTGYYIEDNGSAAYDHIVGTPRIAFRSSRTNWNADVSSGVMTYDATTKTYSFDYVVESDKTDTDFYFKFYVEGTGWLLPLNTSSDINIRANESQQGKTATGNVSWKLLQSQSLYTEYTFTVKILDNGRYLVTAQGTKGRTEFKKGLYLIGEDYDGVNPNSDLHYRFHKLPNGNNEYYFDFLGTEVGPSEQKFSPFNKPVKLALVKEDNSNLIIYGWNDTQYDYNLIDSDGTKTQERELLHDGKGWQINSNAGYEGDNGGMYRLIVKIDEEGNPITWRYESYPNTKVMYKIGGSSNWTVGSFLYSTNGTNYYGTGYYGAGELYKFVYGNKWVPTNNITNHNGAGTYAATVDLSGTATYASLTGAANTASNTVNFVVSNPETEMTYDSEENCWSATVDLIKNSSQFHFQTGSTSWGEDGNAENYDYNHLTSGSTKVNYKGPSGTMKVRFFLNNVLNDWNTSTVNTFTQGSFFYTVEPIDIAPEFTLTPQIAPTTEGKNRVFINNALVDVNVINGSKRPIVFDGAKTTINSDTSTPTEGNTIKVSTPGQLNVGDGKTVNETAATYDFAYSTSDNYVNFWNNHHSSQPVETGGGKDCITVFVRSAYNDTGIYAWDWGQDAYLQEGKSDQQIIDETIQRDQQVKLSNYYPGTYMTEERTLEFNGEKWYYMAFPKANLNTTNKSSRAKDIPCIAVIVDRMNPNLKDQEATDYADTRKTAQSANILENTFYGYTYDPTIYGESGKYTDGIMAGSLGKIEYRLHGDQTAQNLTNRNAVCSVVQKGIVIAESGVATANYFNSETGASGSVAMMTVAGDSNGHTYAQIPEGYDRVYFTKSDDSRYPADGGAIVLSGGYYFESKTEADKYPTILYLNESSTTTYNTFLTTEAETTIESHSYPNGQDYYKKGNADDDLTMLLDPTWDKKVSDPNNPATDAAISWSGISGDGYAHQKTIAANTALEQTIFGLKSGANYTVQAIVYSATAHNNAKLTLTGASSVEKTINFPGTNYGYITKYGRVEKLNKKGNEGKIAKGWTKVEATVAPRSNGSLTIKLTNPSEYILADVTLLENANTPGHFWTKAPTSNSTTDVDLTAEKKFSFFDRGDNLNAVIYASKNAVITMDPELDPANADGGEVNRQAPYNVVLVDGSNATMEHLYITEANIDGLLDPTFYKGDDADLAAANLGAFYTSGHSFGIKKANTTFDVKKVTFDRMFNANQYTAVCLPFSLTRAQVEATYGSGSKVYQLAALDTTTGEITYKTNDQMGVTANVPFLLYAAEGGHSLSNLELSNVSISTTPELQTTISGGKAIGNFEYLTINTHPTDAATNYTFNPVSENGSALGRYAYAKDGCIMKPFRFYLQTDSYINVTQNSAAFNVLFIDEILEEPVIEEEPGEEEPKTDPEEETTGIVSINGDSASAPIFSINGQVVSRNGSRQGLSKGVYIQNGHKFVVK